MPRNVRNFWVNGKADGDKTDVSFGPRAKDGGFALTVLMRDQGGITQGLGMSGTVDAKGVITLRVTFPNGSVKMADDSIVVTTRRDA